MKEYRDWMVIRLEHLESSYRAQARMRDNPALGPQRRENARQFASNYASQVYELKECLAELNKRMEPRPDYLLGGSDIARLAGVGRSAINNWRKRYSDFPQPLQETSSGPIWDVDAILAWLEARGIIEPE